MGGRDVIRELLETPVSELFGALAGVYHRSLEEYGRRIRGEVGPGAAEGGREGQRPSFSIGPPYPREVSVNSEDAGRRIWQAMVEPHIHALCEDIRKNPETYADPLSAVPLLTRMWTRVDPPDKMFLLAAVLLWKQGLEKVCHEAEAGSAREQLGGLIT